MVMKRNLYTCFIGVMFLLSPAVSGQESNLIHVHVADQAVVKTGRKIAVKLTLDVSGLNLGSQQSIRLQPAVVARTGSEELLLQPVIIDGRTRYRVHNRAKALNGEDYTRDAYMAFRYNGKNSRPVIYEAEVSYQPWMADSRLVIREELTGCRNCGEGNAESTLLTPFVTLFTPHYVTPFIEPPAEPVKRRDEVRVARLFFKVNSYQILPGLGENQAQLDEIRRSVETVKENNDLTITGITITGYASPEASMAYNKRLSENRSQALADYIQKLTRLERSLWRVEGMGEDWEGFRREVEQFTRLQDREAVLQLIEDFGERHDDCELRIRKQYPGSYSQLMNEVYGRLRRNEYKIEYKVRNYTLEEAKELIHTQPRLLSVGEIYNVANSYPKDSPEYDDAMLVAAGTYPEKTSAVVNAACVEMRQGNFSQAIGRLENCRMKEEGAVLNALGVAYAQSGMYKKAKESLEKAVQAGSREAGSNLEQLAGVLNDL